MSLSNNPKALRIALIQSAAPSPAHRELQEFLGTDPSLAWLGTISTDAATIQSLAISKPSVVVADLRVSGAIDPGQVFRAILASTPGTQIVAICAPGDEGGAKQALAGGAAACLTRQSDPLSVLRAINDVMRGRMHLSPTGQRAIRNMLNPGAVSAKPR